MVMAKCRTQYEDGTQQRILPQKHKGLTNGLHGNEGGDKLWVMSYKL